MSYSDSLTKQSSSWQVEHRDLQATAMSVDWTGNWVLLAGRRHLALQSLEKYGEVESLNKFQRNSKYEVSAAEWAICQNSQEYCAIASSQSIEVVTWAQGDPTLIHSLRAHTRSITDIDWHSKKAHLLASCSIDTFTHLWDLRDPRKPIMSLSAVCMCKLGTSILSVREGNGDIFLQLAPLRSVSIGCRAI
jgi:WD repeat-containing protein 59